jgi:hypothetical protein
MPLISSSKLAFVNHTVNRTHSPQGALCSSSSRRAGNAEAPAYRHVSREFHRRQDEETARLLTERAVRGADAGRDLERPMAAGRHDGGFRRNGFRFWRHGHFSTRSRTNPGKQAHSSPRVRCQQRWSDAHAAKDSADTQVVCVDLGVNQGTGRTKNSLVASPSATRRPNRAKLPSIYACHHALLGVPAADRRRN